MTAGTIAGAAAQERSYTLPAVRFAVPPAATRVVRAPLWSRPLDFPLVDGDVLARTNGIVAFGSSGRVCGFREVDGRRLWCAAHGSNVAASGGVIAYAGDDGGIAGIDALTGRRLWRFAFPSSKEGAAIFAPQRIPVNYRIASTPAGFLVNRLDARAGHGAPTYGEITASAGRVLWAVQAPFLGESLSAPVVTRAGFAIQFAVGSGATMVSTGYVVTLGPHGGIRTAIRDAWSVLDIRDSTLVVSNDGGIEPTEQHLLTRDVWIADRRTGDIIGRYHYAPDYDANLALLSGPPPILQDPNRQGVEGEFFFATFGTKVYRYRLAEAKNQRPLLVSTSGEYFGGPYHGHIFVARSGGLWMLRPTRRTIEERLVVPSQSRAVRLTVFGDNVYAAFQDGTIAGFNIATGRRVIDAAVPCGPARLGAAKTRVWVVCAGFNSSRLLVFAAPSED